jgi:transposase
MELELPPFPGHFNAPQQKEPVMSQNRKPYSAEFRQQIVELVHAGRKPAELAQEFGCHVSSIHDWILALPSRRQPVRHR